MSDKERLKFELQKIVRHLLEIPESGYDAPFHALYNTSRQQLAAALKFYQEIKTGGKYLHKLPKGNNIKRRQNSCQRPSDYANKGYITPY